MSDKKKQLIHKWHMPSAEQKAECELSAKNAYGQYSERSRSIRMGNFPDMAALNLGDLIGLKELVESDTARDSSKLLQSARAPLSDSQRMLLSTTGLPAPPPIGTTVQEYTLSLLQIAAEVEHALMVQYIFTAISVNSTGANIRRTLNNVAIQEMGHLASVQNLLLLVGGPSAIHMQRDELRNQSNLNPIPFDLDPLSLVALAKYVVAEMPDTIPSAIATNVAKYIDIANQSAGVSLHRVGAIYVLLQWLFMDETTANQWVDLTSLAGFPSDFHLKDADLSQSTLMDEFEATRDEWQADTTTDFILSMPRNCADAVNLLQQIAEQGEGWGTSQDSHFQVFFNLAESIQASGLGGTVHPIVKSPTLKIGIGGVNGRLITASYTKLWGEIFSLQYTLLVLSIEHALRSSRTTQSTLRDSLVELAFKGMRQFIGAMSRILVQLPIDDGSSDKSGPPFDLDPSDIGVATTELRNKHLQLLLRLKNLYAQVRASTEFNPAHNPTLINLENFDARRLALFP